MQHAADQGKILRHKQNVDNIIEIASVADGNVEKQVIQAHRQHNAKEQSKQKCAQHIAHGIRPLIPQKHRHIEAGLGAAAHVNRFGFCDVPDRKNEVMMRIDPVFRGHGIVLDALCNASVLLYAVKRNGARQSVGQLKIPAACAARIGLNAESHPHYICGNPEGRIIPPHLFELARLDLLNGL